ncbi:MAG: DsbA family protein, partial [Bdellovibrionota bacterium]|nr:DsbA family protein [Bdellovibrionota bacterium]
SYISLKRAFDLEKTYDIELNIKPVLPMVMRGLPVPKQKGFYIVKDTARIARSINSPFGKISDPVGKGVENCMALYQYIKDRGKEKEFLLSATTGCWSESLNLANHKDLKKIVSRIGINFDEVEKLLKKEDWREMTSENQKDLENLGLWGVPSFHYKGLSFWGQDRISFLEEIIRFEN